MGIVGSMTGGVAKRLAPGVTGNAIRDILERAIDGVGPIPGAAASADGKLRRSGGQVDDAIERLITQHVRLAGAQGFLTNVGGFVTFAVTIPANVAAVAILQCHLAASIIHLRGYSLDRPAVRDAVLVCLLDSDARKALSKTVGFRVSPAELVMGDSHADLRRLVGQAVTAQLLAGAGGKRVATMVAKRIPVLGGAIGGAGDAWATRRIGRDSAKIPELPLTPLSKG